MVAAAGEGCTGATDPGEAVVAGALGVVEVLGRSATTRPVTASPATTTSARIAASHRRRSTGTAPAAGGGRGGWEGGQRVAGRVAVPLGQFRCRPGPPRDHAQRRSGPPGNDPQRPQGPDNPTRPALPARRQLPVGSLLAGPGLVAGGPLAGLVAVVRRLAGR